MLLTNTGICKGKCHYALETLDSTSKRKFGFQIRTDPGVKGKGEVKAPIISAVTQQNPVALEDAEPGLWTC